MAEQFGHLKTDDLLRLMIWAKGKEVPGFEPKGYRVDICGSPMLYSQYGNRDSIYGWEIDHIKPQALGGSDDLDNLQPLNWKNNNDKGDTYPWKCP